MQTLNPAGVMASVGDHGAYNVQLSQLLSEVWIDRDSSWLAFNERVLAEALDERTPLLERAKFLAIFTSNLDEFFMKRVTGLRAGQAQAQRDGWQRFRHRLLTLLERQAACYRQTIVPELARQGIVLRRWNELTPGQREEAGRYFDANLSPALTPLVIDPTQPFPFLSNLSTSLTFLLHDPARTDPMYGRLKVPTVLKQWVPLEADTAPGEKLFVLLQEIIRGNAAKLYTGMRLGSITVVRLTRDAEVELDEGPGPGLRELVQEQVRQRRYEPVVRLEFGPGADPAIREMLRERFALSPEDVFDMPEEVDYTTLFELLGLPLPALRDPVWTPLPLNLPDGPHSIFDAIRAGDLLLHHPFESFDDTVERFISAAADDPQTVSIKMTAYRIGDDTPFVQSLIRAAESGKQVACVMEIQASFDEARNLHWAAELERVGAHVKFGVTGLKTHAKTALVVRKESTGLRCFVHIGTGNYHVKTARLYADVGLLSCDPVLGRDVVQLFHYLTGHSVAPDCTTLLIAPTTMRPLFIELIRREMENHTAGLPARIVAKMNQLEDPEMIEALCEASMAGVPIDLIVRGFCCLRPGVPGKTETIRVRSIIGRFLEHSRIFHFANGKEHPVDGDFFIGSADWMFRNLSRRVEVATPVLAPGPRAKLWEILDICLRDRRQAWILGQDGSYTQLRPEESSDGPEAMGSHHVLMGLTRARLANGFRSFSA
ncbi:MAG: polyphosphate kinase 1 [Bryobacteraceae bacterium]|nr:polyphosphate kinase 1 [Bryobacteraceae bacterium]